MPAHLFYDGECGLCHLSVRYLLWADPGGETRLAPLGGETFHRHVPVAEQERLPDSLALLTRDGRILTRSEGVLQLLREVGGVWRVLAALGAVVPRGLADAAYDAVARARHRLFARPEDACPVPPGPARARFDP